MSKGGEGCHHCHGYFTAFGGVVSPLSSCILPSTQSWPHVWHDVWHIGTLAQFYSGTLEHWNSGTLTPWHLELWHSGSHPHLRQLSKPTHLPSSTSVTILTANHMHTAQTREIMMVVVLWCTSNLPPHVWYYRGSDHPLCMCRKMWPASSMIVGCVAAYITGKQPSTPNKITHLPVLLNRWKIGRTLMFRPLRAERTSHLCTNLIVTHNTCINTKHF